MKEEYETIFEDFAVNVLFVNCTHVISVKRKVMYKFLIDIMQFRWYFDSFKYLMTHSVLVHVFKV